jgi:hypothetical protein
VTWICIDDKHGSREVFRPSDYLPEHAFRYHVKVTCWLLGLVLRNVCLAAKALFK